MRHTVDLLCFADCPPSREERKVCETLCRRVYVEVLSKPARLVRAAASVLRGQPMSSGFFSSPRFSREVTAALRRSRYDLIFVYCSSMGQFIPLSTTAPVVVDFVDADSAKWRQYAGACRPPRSWLYAREARAVAACEASLGRRAALALTVTEHDARELGGPDGPDFEVTVMPNGTRAPQGAADRPSADIASLQPYVLFVGTMNYRPNVDAVRHFANEIFPLVRQRQRTLNFVITGRDPDRSVRALARIPGITVTGTVPDVYEYIRHAEISVAPFRISQGFHNKIAESLAVGTPVVTSSRARDGIGLSEWEGLFVADAPAEFAAKVDFLLSQPRLRHEFRSAAAQVRQKLSWDTCLRCLDQFLLQLAEPRSASVAVAGDY